MPPLAPAVGETGATGMGGFQPATGEGAAIGGNNPPGTVGTTGTVGEVIGDPPP